MWFDFTAIRAVQVQPEGVKLALILTLHLHIWKEEKITEMAVIMHVFLNAYTEIEAKHV